MDAARSFFERGLTQLRESLAEAASEAGGGSGSAGGSEAAAEAQRGAGHVGGPRVGSFGSATGGLAGGSGGGSFSLDRITERLGAALRDASSALDSGYQASRLMGSEGGAAPAVPPFGPPPDSLDRIKKELSASCINLHNLRRLTCYGIPDCNVRTVVWQLLLGYLPPSPEDWASTLAKRRTQYRVFCDELMLDKKRVSTGEASWIQQRTLEQPKADRQESSAEPKDVTSSDHPLSLELSSQWNTFFQDSEVMMQIERDVLRTQPTMAFFTGDSDAAATHREELKRALFLYAKLNPGLRYIQGMNELIAPLYYLFKHGADVASHQHAEADAFWCFMELISETRDHFCAQLDNASTGIRATMRRLMMVLRHYDDALWRHVEVVCKVDPQFYAFRWITLLLSQEFPLQDIFRIWDFILSDEAGRTDCLLRVCAAMMLHVRATLMRGDFTVIMKTLQRFPPVDINVILARAAQLPHVPDDSQ